MITHEFDLDTAGDVENDRPATDLVPRSGYGGRVLVRIVLALVGVAVGSVLAATPASGPGAAPVTSTVTTLNVTVNGTTPTVLLELTVTNQRPHPVRLTELVLSDQQGTVRLPLSATVGPGATGTLQETTHPECPTSAGSDYGSYSGSGTLTGYVRTAGADRVPLILDGQLAQRGGFCALLDQQLPRGWRTPLSASSTTADGTALDLTVPGLTGRSLVGGTPDAQGLIQPSVYIGDELVPAVLTGPKDLRLLGPAPCIDGGVGDPVPMSFRMLTRESGQLQSLQVEAGPELAIWVTQNC